AVQEFCQRGGGTPIPYDPPQRLVTSGLYRYVANPMQLSCSIVLMFFGAMLRNGWLASAGAMSFFYSLGLATWDEGEDMRQRCGAGWREYKNAVRAWRVRWLPWFPPDRPPARLYIAETCGPCSQLRRWFQKRGPLQLNIMAAEQYPSRRLLRITY